MNAADEERLCAEAAEPVRQSRDCEHGRLRRKCELCENARYMLALQAIADTRIRPDTDFRELCAVLIAIANVALEAQS